MSEVRVQIKWTPPIWIPRIFWAANRKIFIVKNRSHSTVETKIREFSATNTFSYTYVCFKHYVFNSIALYYFPDLFPLINHEHAILKSYDMIRPVVRIWYENPDRDRRQVTFILLFQFYWALTLDHSSSLLGFPSRHHLDNIFCR